MRRYERDHLGRLRSILIEESSDESSESSDSEQEEDTAMAVVYKSISPWAKVGLDLSDSSFSKIHSRESRFEDSEEKYDLQPEKFTNFRNNLIDKMNTIHGTGVLTVTDGTDNYLVLKEYSKITENALTASRSLRWPDTNPNHTTQAEADAFTDAQIKASVFGAYLYSGLTESAKDQLRGDSAIFEVKVVGSNETYRDGASLFWKIAEIVDPDNGHLIEEVKMEIRKLHVKDFGFSVIKMLAHFKMLMKRLQELGATYDDDEKFFDFWAMCRTMKEEEFTRYVKASKDTYNKTAKAQRDSLATYMRDMQRKETAMRTDGEWNVMSPRDAMVMALVNMVENRSSKGSNKDRNKSGQPKDKASDGNDSDGDSKPPPSNDKSKRRRERKVPEWKMQAPSKGESLTQERDGRKYHWCSKCRDGKGMWAMHEEKDHKDGYSRRTQNKASDDKSKASSSDGKGDSDPTVKVNQKLLSNAKYYLAQFEDQDFQ